LAQQHFTSSTAFLQELNLHVDVLLDFFTIFRCFNFFKLCYLLKNRIDLTFFTRVLYFFNAQSFSGTLAGLFAPLFSYVAIKNSKKPLTGVLMYRQPD